jgi:two-component system sensor histidine kinase RpfC
MDLHMPGSSGWDVLGRIEVLRRTQAVPPIVMLSADSSQDAVRIAFKAGARAYLTKPIAAQRLLDIIETIAAERSLATAAKAWQPELPGIEPRHGGTTPLDEMRVLASPSEFASFLDLCSTASDGHVDALRDAMLEGDIAAASESLHALRNVLGNLGVPGANRVCDDLAVLIDAGGDMRPAVAELDTLCRSVGHYVTMQRRQAGVPAGSAA